MIIVRQAVFTGLALEINSVAETMKPPALVIAIRFPEDDADLGVELHKTNLGTNPAWRRGQAPCQAPRCHAAAQLAEHGPQNSAAEPFAYGLGHERTDCDAGRRGRLGDFATGLEQQTANDYRNAKTQSSGGSIEGHWPHATVTRYRLIVDGARRPY